MEKCLNIHKIVAKYFNLFKNTLFEIIKAFIYF